MAMIDITRTAIHPAPHRSATALPVLIGVLPSNGSHERVTSCPDYQRHARARRPARRLGGGRRHCRCSSGVTSAPRSQFPYGYFTPFSD